MASIEIPTSESQCDLLARFKEQPVDRQQEMISELSAKLGGISITKLPNESDVDFRIRSFSELLNMLPPDSVLPQLKCDVDHSTIEPVEGEEFVVMVPFALPCTMIEPVEPVEGEEPGFTPNYNESNNQSEDFSTLVKTTEPFVGKVTPIVGTCATIQPVEGEEPGFNPNYNCDSKN